MGVPSPSYTCAIIRQDSKFYFFDPHSGAETGMVIAERFATLTVHKHLPDLIQFLRNLAASTGGQKDKPFEVARVNVIETEPDSAYDHSDSFSGYSELSEADVAFKIFIAEEKAKNIADETDFESSDLSLSNFDNKSTCSMKSIVS